MILAPLLWVACAKHAPTTPVPAAPEFPVTLHLAAINDFHGGLYEMPVKNHDGVVFGGLPWLVAAVDALRAEHPDLVVLDGGDEFQGSWPVNATHGKGSIEALRLVRVDAAAVGNHEFDYGGLEGGHPLRGAIEAGVRDANWFVAANIENEDGTPWLPPGLARFKVVERQGVRIGVIGLSTTDTPTTTNPTNVADLRFVDVVEAVNEVLPEVKAADVDVTVLVGHLTGSCKPGAYETDGDDDCVPDGEIGRLLTELPEGTFDVMVLGHAHTVLHHRVGRTFLLEDRWAGHLIGRLDLVVGEGGVDVEQSVLHEPWALSHAPVDPGCEDRPFPTDPLEVGGRMLTPDPLAITLIDSLEAQAGSLCDELGCAARTLHRSDAELGQWMADATLAAFPEADLAIQNAGGVRADLPEGTVRRESLQRVMPFDNRALLVQMTGAQVREMFRIGVSGAHGALLPAGAEVRYDPSKEGGTDRDGDGQVAEWERDRLCEVTVKGAPLDDAATYQVAVSDFLYKGGDHLGPAFEGAPVVETGELLRDLMYVSAQQTEGCIAAAPVAPRVQEAACP
ncbi:MAG: bifunctional metallophosphatase/5'-nucleotidase [Alphaproteobacteria bacterium]|nr:bifunctional metallophosphatase/5'-nucleotidase [Alphaproteobacteria bacterium]